MHGFDQSLGNSLAPVFRADQQDVQNPGGRETQGVANMVAKGEANYLPVNKSSESD
jgi:hypothetical protein